MFLSRVPHMAADFLGIFQICWSDEKRTGNDAFGCRARRRFLTASSRLWLTYRRALNATGYPVEVTRSDGRGRKGRNWLLLLAADQQGLVIENGR